MQFRESAKRAILLCVLLTIVGVYVIGAFFHMIENNVGFNAAIQSPIDTVNFIINGNSDIQFLVWFSPILLLSLLLSWQKDKIIQKKFEDVSDIGVHGSAKWGKPRELMNGKFFTKASESKVKNTPTNVVKLPEGIILAEIAKTRELIIMPPELKTVNRNVFVVGASGSGKTQAFVIGNIINNRTPSIIVTDPKGELYRDTHKIKRDQGYKVVKVDFSNFKQDSYNPLDYVTDDESAKEVANIIASNSTEEGSPDFWAKAGIDYLVGFILYAKAEYGSDANMATVLTMISEAGRDEDYFPNLIEEIPSDHPAYPSFQMASMSEDKARSSIFTTLSQQVNIFTMSKVRGMTSKSDFHFGDLQKEKTIIYIKMRMQSNPFKQLTAMFFDQLINNLYEIAGDNDAELPIPTMFIMDEFPNLGRIDQYPNVLATCRGLGISMITIVQSISQLEEKRLYGQENTKSLLNNHDTHLFLGTKDPNTAKYYSTELIGDMTARMDQTSDGPKKKLVDNTTSHSEQYIKRPLITSQELIGKDPNMAVVIVTGYSPLKAEKAWQFKIYGDLLKEYDTLRPTLYPGAEPIEEEEENEETITEPLTEDPSEEPEELVEVDDVENILNTLSEEEAEAFEKEKEENQEESEEEPTEEELEIADVDIDEEDRLELEKEMEEELETEQITDDVDNFLDEIENESNKKKEEELSR